MRTLDNHAAMGLTVALVLLGIALFSSIHVVRACLAEDEAAYVADPPLVGPDDPR